MSIFKEFDAILSGLRPSQYRPMWQLYNYDGSQDYDGEKMVEAVFSEKDAELFIDWIIGDTAWFKRMPLGKIPWSVALNTILKLAKYYEDVYDDTKNEIFSDENRIMLDINREYEAYISDVKAYFEANWEKIADLNIKEAQKLYPYKKPIRKVFYEALEAIEKIIRSHIGEKTMLPISTYMKGGILYTLAHGKKVEISADPDIKRLYDSLFSAKKDRITLDLYLQPDSSMVTENAKSSGIKIGRIIKGIHLSAQVYFSEIRNDEQEAEYLQEVLNTTRYPASMKQYINDYFIDGLYRMATKSNRVIRVGKILQAISKMKVDIPEILYAIKNYHFAKVSSTKNEELIIILSRHPYDIAGMSTNRGWTSCMNLETGQYGHYVPSSIAGGVLIAYLCNKNDTNINHPLGRVLIKPCIREGEKINKKPVNFILRCSNIYGTFSKSYIEQLQDWLDKHWNDKVQITPGRYELTRMAYQENEDMDWEYTEDSKWKQHRINRSRL